ncbi:hypothetical protein [Parasitella parasitica]|uniref:Chromo domain-containing protein n=1 Tax=Parasitella parasitica TaxID=35722 RepID=A0A0B7N2E3_9FUNG|nr:hypothetical protein [Parasitella parasitica]
MSNQTPRLTQNDMDIDKEYHLTAEQRSQMDKFLESPMHCKLFVQKISITGDSDLRKAEIILSRETSKQPSTMEYYVHYVEFNKRLDEWVPLSRLDFSKGVEFPEPVAVKKTKKNAHLKTSAAASRASTPTKRRGDEEFGEENIQEEIVLAEDGEEEDEQGTVVKKPSRINQRFPKNKRLKNYEHQAP